MRARWIRNSIGTLALVTGIAHAQLPFPASDIQQASGRYDKLMSVYGARIRVSEKYDPSVMTEETLHHWPEFKATGEVIASVSIFRDGAAWRQELEYSLDKRLQEIGNHVDLIEGFDGDRLYRFIPRGRSLSIRKPTSDAQRAGATLPVEGMFFRPARSYTLSECFHLGLVRETTMIDEDNVQLIIESSNPPFKRRVTFSRRAGWFPREWCDVPEKSDDFRACATLEFAEHDGSLVPARGTFRQASRVGDGRFLEEYHKFAFETVEWTADSRSPAIRKIEIPANCLVSDETSAPTLYKTDASGSRILLDKKNILADVRQSPYGATLLWGTALAVFAIFLWKTRRLRAA